MTRPKFSRVSKRQRAEERRRSARWRRRRQRLVWGAIIGAVVAVPVLALLDRTGPDERVKAEVVRTHRWVHVTPGSGSHTHIRATLRIEGRNEVTVDRADGFERGQWVPVWVRRGPITGWPYFEDLAGPEDVPPEPAPAAEPAPADAPAGAPAVDPGAAPEAGGEAPPP